jgi:hypothetical protein
MSAVGLEEYTQLLIKFGADVERFCGSGWQGVQALQQLRKGPPRRKYARRHIPQVSL